MLHARPYQTAALDATRAAFAAGARAPLLVAPTGAGKTAIAALLLAAHVARHPAGRGLVVVPRLELAQQTVATLARVGLRAGVVSGDAEISTFAPDAPVQVATVQTLVARDMTIRTTLQVWDEAHHYVSPEWFATFERFRTMGCPMVGLTATPCRADGVALGEAFDTLIPVASVRELTAAGHLVPCDVIAPPARQSGLAMAPVDAYAAHGGGRRCIVFARDQKHVRDLCDAFRAAGAPVSFVDSSLTGNDRRARIAAFRAGKTRVLVNCQILTEGFDDPSVEVVILASGCSHAGSYLQKIGRALRPSPGTGKARALVIDLVGAVHDHGLPDDDRAYSLTGRAITTADGILALRQCAACGGVWRADEFRDATCPRCGTVAPGRPDPRIRRAELEQIREAHTPDRRIAALRELYGRARAQGRKTAWAHFVFRARYHRFPTTAEQTAAASG